MGGGNAAGSVGRYGGGGGEVGPVADGGCDYGDAVLAPAGFQAGGAGAGDEVVGGEAVGLAGEGHLVARGPRAVALRRWTLRGIVVQIGAEPFFRLGEGLAGAGGVVGELILPELTDGEVFCVGVVTVEAADGARGIHGATFGKVDPDFLLDGNEVPDLRFVAMVGARGIAGGGADAAVFLADDFLRRELFVAAVAAEVAGALVEILGHGLGDAVAEGLDEDGLVVVAGGFEFGGEELDAGGGGDGELAKEVDAAGVARGEVIGEAMIKLLSGFLELLAEEVEGVEGAAALFVSVDLDGVADAVGGPEGEAGAGLETVLGDDAGEHREGIGVEFSGFDADHFVGEDVGVAAVEFPGAEEGRPIDKLLVEECFYRYIGKDAGAEEFRARKVGPDPVE